MTVLLSVYEAKTRFSEVIRQVREGRTITISYRGEPVAEISPARGPESFADRLEDLRRRGILTRSKGPHSELAPGAPQPGARAAAGSP
ncbi:MAG: type II toxin-antitoxin system prevent-host-death family antitoxin [Gammaproteobacteria bacterium]|nr:type II toxin-antitoxin system prevent-host-death family antitoxin [Gammaproteobacteria bacterium]